MTAEERDANERSYQEIVINHQGHSVVSNGAGGVTVSTGNHPYSGTETSIVTTISNIASTPILVTEREVIDGKEQICLPNHIIAHAGPEHHSAKIYHDFVPVGDGGEVNYRC